MGGLLKDQDQISRQFPMVTDDMSASSSIQSITGETVQLYYSNSGTRTSDAGQAAGTAVTGQLANKNILDAGGGYIATYNDTSLSFTGNCFTTEVELPQRIAEANVRASWANKMSYITANLNNGEYCVDYRSGTIYGVKATTTSSLTSTSYKINQAQSGTSGSASSTTDITKIAGTAVSAKNAAYSEAPLGTGLEFEALGSLTTDGGTAGDKVPAKGTATGITYTQLTDGTSTPGILANIPETTDEAEEGMVVASAIYGYDSEGSANSRLRALQVAADNAGVSATPNVGIVGGIYKNADDTYDDNDAVPFHFTSSGELRTAGGSSVTAQYRATTTGRGDGTATYASGTTLTIAGTPFTLADEDLVYIREVDATANTSTLWVNGQSGVQFEISSGTLTKTGGADFSANGVYELGYNGQDKGYDASNAANRNEIINRDTDKDTADTLLSLTNITANTTAYGYIDVENYKYLIIQNETSGTTPTDVLTLTLEATAQNDGTAAASCTYQDVTTALTGAASYVDTDCMWIIDTPVKYKYLRVKYNTSDTGGDDADLTTYVIKGV